MNLINVDQSKCIKCGICSEVCPSSVLSIDNNGVNVIAPANCISCGHCAAACPQGAIDNISAPMCSPSDTICSSPIDSKTAEFFLRSRRSVRCYKDTVVPKEKLLELVNIAHYAPTASNSQGVSYIIIENKKLLEEAVKVVVEWMEQQMGDNPHWSFARHIKNYRVFKTDTILRDAPNLILAMSSKDFTNGRQNSISALSYVELYAPTIGLGSCWAGLFEMCAFSGYAPLLKLLNIPNDKVITGALMVGYPKYKYKKLVNRNPLDVQFIK